LAFAVSATPLVNLTPAMTRGKRFSPFNRRQVLDAAITSLKTMRHAVRCESAPFVRTVLWRTVAKTLSEPRRVCRRPIALSSYAAAAWFSSEA